MSDILFESTALSSCSRSRQLCKNVHTLQCDVDNDGGSELQDSLVELNVWTRLDILDAMLSFLHSGVSMAMDESGGRQRTAVTRCHRIPWNFVVCYPSRYVIQIVVVEFTQVCAAAADPRLFRSSTLQVILKEKKRYIYFIHSAQCIKLDFSPVRLNVAL